MKSGKIIIVFKVLSSFLDYEKYIFYHTKRIFRMSLKINVPPAYTILTQQRIFAGW